MEVWTQWLNAIHGLLNFLASEMNLGTGMSIVVLTLALRTLILPISWRMAYQGSIRQKKMQRLQPELERMKLELADQPRLYAERMMKLYQAHDLKVMDWRSVLGSLIQMPLFVGMYQTLRTGLNGARFLWVETLSRPDPVFAVLAGLTMMFLMASNPDLPEQMRLLLIVIPSILALIAALKLCSALAVYWTVSNCYSAIQTGAMHYVVAKRIKAGVVKI
jgi:YidC/Oxa1 family membrane protein insertase